MDKKAKDILFKTFWKSGWIDNPKTSKEDFEYAKSKGMMFDPITISHDDCVREICDLSEKIPMDKVSKAFLCSLSTRRLDWRSGIASYFTAKQIIPHSFNKAVSGHGYDKNGNINYTSYTCGVCRDLKYGIIGDEKYIKEDLNVLNFERIKWGGVRHGELLYTLFDLRQFDLEDISEPSEEDIAIFKNMLTLIAASGKDDYPGALEKRFAGAVPSSKNERQVLIEILACIDVLKPGSFDRPIRGKNDWTFAEYWRGEDSYDQEAVNRNFGKYIK